MRKYLKLALFIVAIAALLTVCAFAEDGVNEVDNTNHTYTATASGLTASTDYVLLVVKSSAVTGTGADAKISGLTADAILYIDQQKSDANGAVSFGSSDSTWQPKSFAGGTAFIAGDGLAAPKYLGTLASYGVTVGSGTDKAVNATGTGTGISFSYSGTGKATAPTITIKDGNTSYAVTISVNGANATYAVNAPEGEYDFTISKACYLTYKGKVTVKEGQALPSISLIAGDLDQNGAVGFQDLSALLGEYGKTQQNYTSDIDQNGAVGFQDLSALLGGYGKSYN